MVRVPAGVYRLGSDRGVPNDGEAPVRDVQLPAFRIDTTAVTNAQFRTFVDATGYVTDAERAGWSFVFASAVHPQAFEAIVRDTAVPRAPWWLAVRGACWRAPDGPGSDMAERIEHPVVHVSWNDAQAFCHWAGKELPTEAQWEAAARGGLRDAVYPWGDELHPAGQHRCNVWQGTFPAHNTALDGFLGTAPVRSFAPNGYGLFEMAGNVWEWCRDWWSVNWHAANLPATRIAPLGPPTGDSKVIRGGSYLCHASYCDRYRVSARSFNTPDSATAHMGFRCCAPLV